MLLTTTRTVTKEEKVCTGIECDKCKKVYTTESWEEQKEFQEFVHINYVGGYGSITGDMVKVTCDLCQYCAEELLGQYYRFEEVDPYE